jgi:hypothetical protein
MGSLSISQTLLLNFLKIYHVLYWMTLIRHKKIGMFMIVVIPGSLIISMTSVTSHSTMPMTCTLTETTLLDYTITVAIPVMSQAVDTCTRRR